MSEYDAGIFILSSSWEVLLEAAAVQKGEEIVEF